MFNLIRFDFNKAQALLVVISQCNNQINEIACSLGSEVKSAGSYWQGDSYIAFKESYDGASGGKAVITGIAESSSSMSNYLTMAVDKKKGWEQSGQWCF